MPEPRTARTAPAGYVCCAFCRRYVPPDRLDGNRCLDVERCRRRMVRQARRLTRKEERLLKYGEAAATKRG